MPRLLTAAALTFLVMASLGALWYHTNTEDAEDFVGLLYDNATRLVTEYGSVALEGIGDVATGGSAALDELGDAARETADMVAESVVEPAAEPVTEPPAGVPDTAPPSPFDRTIWPDDTAHDSGQDAQEAESAPSMQSGPEAGTGAVPQPTKTEQIEGLIHTMTNQHREVAGLQPLDRITKIDQIARAHSEDMAKRNYFEHDTPEGLDPTDRGNAAGYPCRKDHGSYYTYGLAENIFMHTGTWYGAEHLADEIMKGWMNSFGHRQNIMESDYDRIGIGVAIGGGAVYATQNFC